MNNNNSNPYPWLAGPATETDFAAWEAYLRALRDQIKADWAATRSAYLSLKKVRESLGLTFIDAAPKTEGGGPDPHAWTPALEQDAQDLQAMVVLISSALDDAVAGKRKLLWDKDKGYLVIESLPEDVVRLEFDANGVPTLVDAKTGSPTHVTSTIGVGIPKVVWAGVATATVSVLALPAYFIADAAVNGLRTVAEQKTIGVIGTKAFDCVQSGKCTPEQAEAIAKAPYAGAAGVREAGAKEQAKKDEGTSDFMKAVTTLGWIALGLGVLYTAVRFIPPVGQLVPRAAPALPNPISPKPQSGYAYEHRGRNWRSSSDERWDIVVYTPTGRERYIGTRRVDDALVNVWVADGRHVAQTVVMTGSARRAA